LVTPLLPPLLELPLLEPPLLLPLLLEPPPLLAPLLPLLLEAPLLAAPESLPPPSPAAAENGAPAHATPSAPDAATRVQPRTNLMGVTLSPTRPQCTRGTGESTPG
jgi:hypothetical protein